MKKENGHYPNAPITEAIIDFRTILSPEITVNHLKKMSDETIKNYSVVDDIFVRRGKIKFPNKADIEEKPSMKASSENVGIICKGSNNKRIYQARLDGFTFGADT